MAELFEQPSNRRPFGGIVNPFIAPRPAPPPSPGTPIPDPNAWRHAFGPNRFRRAASRGRAAAQGGAAQGRAATNRLPPTPRAPPAPAVPTVYTTLNPQAWGHPDLQPGLAPRPPFAEDHTYADFQRLAFSHPPAAAAAAVPLGLGRNGRAGTAPYPTVPPLLRQVGHVRDAGAHALASLAAALLAMVRGAGLFLVLLWRAACSCSCSCSCSSSPALLLLLARLWAAARHLVLAYVVFWSALSCLRFWVWALGLTPVALGFTWKVPAEAYALRREFTGWSVTPWRWILD